MRKRLLFRSACNLRKSPRSEERRERGSSATELLVLTAPLCVLSMVLASKLAATSSAHFRALEKASLLTQQAARRPCGGTPKLNAPLHPEADPGLMQDIAPLVTLSGLTVPFAIKMQLGPKGPPVSAKLKSVVDKARLFWMNRNSKAVRKLAAKELASLVTPSPVTVVNIALAGALFLAKTFIEIPPDLLTSPDLLEANWVTRGVSVQVAPYHFKAQADARIAGPDAVSESATFVCNEPDDGDKLRDKKRDLLLTMGVFESEGIFP